MLATAATALPTEPGWAFEFKWDGVRALIDVSEHDGGQQIVIRSRNGNDVTAAYPELVALAADAGDALVDGEIVAFRDGRPSFDLLQTRMHVRGPTQARRLAATAPVTFIAFDLLRRYGVDLTARPWAERRATLERWAADRPDWTLSPSFDDGPATRDAAALHGLEGVVAKRVDSVYRPGVRSAEWRKLRFVHAGDYVVVGWEAAAERPDDLSSLVLATWNGGSPAFVGKAGSGLDARTARQLRGLLTSSDTSVLAEIPPLTPGRVVRWVRPEVVVEVEYAARTDDGRLRHPVFRRVRSDKGPDEAEG